MAIIDCFPFYNELDLLEVHLETMDSTVDFYVITEARQSHSGLDKPLFLSDNWQRFKKFEAKIILNIVDKFPEGVRLFEADWYQREHAKPILEGLMKPGDFLIYGDVDEIPRPSAVRRAIRLLNSSPGKEVAHLAQDLFYYYLNLREESGKLLSFMGEYPGVKDRKWLGTTVNKWEAVAHEKLTDLRNPERKEVGLRIPYGGWHFSWVGGPGRESAEERVMTKLINTAHQEFKTPRNLRNLRKRVAIGKDLINRPGAKFRQVSDLSFLPEYILENIEKYEHLLTQK
jgi:beta-1,4-mannosyl-glycoprotein beta-1,4-N-acetylglucosaminyltransferase